MNIKKFFSNLGESVSAGETFADSLSYLRWIYGFGNRTELVRIRFKLRDPVGKIALTVRLNNGSDAFIFSEVFQHRYYDFHLGFDPKTILDLGANIGLTAIFLSRKFRNAEIICVEPMPGNVELLKTNLRDNDVAAIVYAKAISVNNEPVIMQRAPNDYGHKVANLSFGRSFAGETVGVPSICIPTLLAETGWSDIDLLKIDIEGYEGILLKENCEWLNRVRAICIECHEGFGEADLDLVAHRFGFRKPKQLPGMWLMTRVGD